MLRLHHLMAVLAMLTWHVLGMNLTDLPTEAARLLIHRRDVTTSNEILPEGCVPVTPCKKVRRQYAPPYPPGPSPIPDGIEVDCKPDVLECTGPYWETPEKRAFFLDRARLLALLDDPEEQITDSTIGDVDVPFVTSAVGTPLSVPFATSAVGTPVSVPASNDDTHVSFHPSASLVNNVPPKAYTAHKRSISHKSTQIRPTKLRSDDEVTHPTEHTRTDAARPHTRRGNPLIPDVPAVQLLNGATPAEDSVMAPVVPTNEPWPTNPKYGHHGTPSPRDVSAPKMARIERRQKSAVYDRQADEVDVIVKPIFPTRTTLSITEDPTSKYIKPPSQDITAPTTLLTKIRRRSPVDLSPEQLTSAALDPRSPNPRAATRPPPPSPWDAAGSRPLTPAASTVTPQLPIWSDPS